jgi:hypothetical protein
MLIQNGLVAVYFLNEQIISGTGRFFSRQDVAEGDSPTHCFVRTVQFDRKTGKSPARPRVEIEPWDQEVHGPLLAAIESKKSKKREKWEKADKDLLDRGLACRTREEMRLIFVEVAKKWGRQ